MCRLWLACEYVMFLGKPFDLLFFFLFSVYKLRPIYTANLFHRKIVKNLTYPQEKIDHNLLNNIKVLNIRMGLHSIVWLLFRSWVHQSASLLCDSTRPCSRQKHGRKVSLWLCHVFLGTSSLTLSGPQRVSWVWLLQTSHLVTTFPKSLPPMCSKSSQALKPVS